MDVDVCDAWTCERLLGHSGFHESGSGREWDDVVHGETPDEGHGHCLSWIQYFGSLVGCSRGGGHPGMHHEVQHRVEWVGGGRVVWTDLVACDGVAMISGAERVCELVVGHSVPHSGDGGMWMVVCEDGCDLTRGHLGEHGGGSSDVVILMPED